MAKLNLPISIEVFRRRLANVDAQPQLALLGLLAGIVTAAVILVFRYFIDVSLSALPGGGVENFEGLDIVTRIGVVMVGAVLLGLLLNRYSPSTRRVGVVHVMERLSLHQGNLPFKNAVIQFFGGRHRADLRSIRRPRGASDPPRSHRRKLLGQSSKLPNNSMRAMVACGTAAAIASSFNTPIAGVIFAMEVVMMEYTIASFIPVIVAAVTSTIITRSSTAQNPRSKSCPPTFTGL